MRDPYEAFRGHVGKLTSLARLDLLLRGAVRGLFFGLLSGAIAAAALGTVRLPLGALPAAGIFAGAGMTAGAAASLLRRVDARRLLIQADRTLGSHDLASTALELAASPSQGVFSRPVVEDAARLLAGVAPRRLLGKLRLPLLPFLPLLAAAVVLAALFPFDLRILLASLRHQDSGLVLIGEDLQGYGRRMEETARARGLGRSLALSQELQQLGRELADSSIQQDDALDRLAQLERRLAREFDLQATGPTDGGSAGSRKGAASGEGSAAGTGTGAGRDIGPGRTSSQELKDLEDSLRKLREAMEKASGTDKTAGGSEDSQSPKATEPPATQPPRDGSRSPSPSADAAGHGPDSGAAEGFAGEQGGTGREGESELGAGQGNQPSSAAGTVPAPEKKGPPSEIAGGNPEDPLSPVPSATAEGDAAKMLVRSLPDWSGSRLPDAQVLRDYAQQAESALSKDEVPPKLREFVKNYFMNIGLGPGEE